MKCFGTFLLTAATVLQIISFQPSNGLELPLCIGILGNCDSTTNGPTDNNPNDPASESKVLLQSGFTDFNKTVDYAQSLAFNGFDQASQLFLIHPRSALQRLQDAIQDCQQKFYESGIPVLFNMGKAMGPFDGTSVREAFVLASQPVQTSAMKFFDTMRTARNLAMQGMTIGGTASKQVIEAIRQDFQADFADLYEKIPIALKKTIEAVSNVQSLTRSLQNENQNSDIVANDNDATAAKAQIEKAAQSAINNGANEQNVEKLKTSLIKLLGETAEIEFRVIKGFTDFQKTIDVDPTKAKNLLLDNCETTYDEIEKIITKICLEFGNVDNKFSASQVGKAIVAIEQGNNEVTNAINVAKGIAIGSLKYESKVRKMVLNAGIEVAKYGKIFLFQKIVEAATDAFENF